MNSIKIICLGVLLALVSGCSKQKINTAPACVYQAVDTLNSKYSIQTESIDEYLFQGKHVYVVNITMCCDIPSPVYSSDCNVICTLGGFAANYTCEGQRFDSVAVFIQKVWHR